MNRESINKELVETAMRLINPSFESEIRRGEGLIQQSSQLLGCITILSVALLTPAPALFEFYGGAVEDITIHQVKLAWMYLVVMALLTLALILVLAALAGSRHKTPSSPGKQYEFVYTKLASLLEEKFDQEGFDIGKEVAKTIKNGLDPIYLDMETHHNRMSKYLKTSQLIIIIACTLSTAFSVHLVLALG